MLQSPSFTGAGAVQSLTQRIDDYGINEVDAQLRMEVLTKIRDGAGNHYFRAWAENAIALELTREWLKQAYSAKQDNLLSETTMPLLHIIDRLPLTVDSLKASKLGKLVVRLVKEPPTPGEFGLSHYVP
jgi:protein phosphatase 1 regulatory subunit 10